tara:strand:- start:62 stop:691 length:630 start_codon:yes stop_codon:yes gene_type:complete
MKKVIIYSLALMYLSACGGNRIRTEDNSNQTISEDSTNLANDNKSALAEEINEVNPEEIECNKVEVHVYLDDPDDSGTNIRKNPGGDVVLKLIKDDQDFEFLMTLTEAKDGWFLVQSPISGIDNDFEIKDGQGWIHGSVISVDTRNYGGQEIEILDKPNNGSVVRVIKEEAYGLKIKDICGPWVKIEYKGTIGWVEGQWLCGNPLTTCS